MVLEEIDSNIQTVTPKEQNVDSLKPFTLEILTLIKDIQQQHGLRHEDYQRYRGYCSRRVGRLRKVLKLPQGDRRHFKKRNVTETHINNALSDERLLHLPLILAERSWAYAMQLRLESNTEPRKKFHMIRKLRKACGYALQLEELSKLERCDARTKLEVQAYVAWMHGTLHFELQMWQSAADNLKKAQVVYEKLASALPEDKQLPYKQRIDELSPSLRYCAYNIGEERTIDLPELRTLGVLENFDKLVLQSKEKSSTILQEVEWCGLKVPICIEKVQLFLQSLVNFDESLNKAEDNSKRIQIIETMFIDLRDAIAITRDEIRPENKDAQLLLQYLLSIRIERTIQRNMYLIQQSRKPQEIVRLLDIITQQMNELTQLESLQNQEKVQTTFANRLLAYRALRCFYLAKSHATLHRWAEASAIFERSVKYAKDAIRNKCSGEIKTLLDTVVEDVPSELALMRAQAVLEQEQETTPVVPTKHSKNKKPLIEKLNEFHENPQYLTKNPNIVTMPPTMEPVPAKPLFYDLALNYVEFPSLEDKIDDGQSKQKQAGGISGFVKGMLGWGGSSKK